MKATISLKFDIEVDPKWYPEYIKTIDDICKYEMENKQNLIEYTLCEDADRGLNIKIEPKREEDK